MPRSALQLVGVLLLATLAVTRAGSQNSQPDATHPTMTPPPDAALVTSVRAFYEQNAPVVEVVSTHQVVPSIHFLDSPPRLIIDLANARMGPEPKRIPVLQENILTLRTEQYQKDPPIARITVDLLVPYAFTWDIAGNRLMVRLKPVHDPSQDPSAAGRKSPSAPTIVPVTNGVGDVVLSDKRLAAGSSLTAGPETAVLHLSRGGEVRVCPGTTVSVTASGNARDLMLGMSTGSLETHYALEASTDSVLTPDFRILFAGPGQFHYAVSADSHGNTCVRGLPGNTSSATVSELMGNRTYQVKPTEQAMFHAGHIDKVDSDVPVECGCPAPVPVMRAATLGSPDSDLPRNTILAPGGAPPPAALKPGNVAPANLSTGSEAQPLPPSQPNDIHVQVDAPLVFRGRKSSAAPPAPTDEVAALPVINPLDRHFWLEVPAQPPPAVRKPLLRRIKGFFAALFR